MTDTNTTNQQPDLRDNLPFRRSINGQPNPKPRTYPSGQYAPGTVRKVEGPKRGG